MISKLARRCQQKRLTVIYMEYTQRTAAKNSRAVNSIDKAAQQQKVSIANSPERSRSRMTGGRQSTTLDDQSINHGSNNDLSIEYAAATKSSIMEISLCKQTATLGKLANSRPTNLEQATRQ
ncbi:hypothetical protein R1flu_026331 [Riccia fluitans]|uniref:Uncharacterized protein n=1 Tax=Riccia fluitans TaxID=41844 RepID=A0ABD1XGE2_9MARC